MKRILVLSDLHCGHHVGLTPPEFWMSEKSKPGKCQRALWGAFEEMLSEFRHPFDLLIVNGDAIDGKGAKSGGTEQITTDREEQVAIATEALTFIKTKSIRMTYGTGYHTAGEGGEDWDNILAKAVGAEEIGSHLWIDAEGIILDFKHHVGSSGIPHGRSTAVGRERLWNVLWSESKQCPRADILVRSHVHYHAMSGGPDWLAMTTPALQGLGSKYGSRRCNGLVDFGFVYFECDNGRYTWQAHTRRVQEQARKAVRI